MGKSIIQTNTKHSVFAPLNAEGLQSKKHFVKVNRVRYCGEFPVYNMEVEKHHNFAVEGGLIVHNCIDATRYALCDWIVKDKPKAVDTRTTEEKFFNKQPKPDMYGRGAKINPKSLWG